MREPPAHPPSGPQLDRRQVLGSLFLPALAVGAWLRPERVLAALAELASESATPEQIARDRSVWARVQAAFEVDRTLVNLNSGGVSPAPAVVLQAMARLEVASNQAPPYSLWQELEPRREGIRRDLAEMLGCDAEEVALTRNASEGLEICQLGFDLRPGDEVVTTTQDYSRMLATFEQRQRREGIVLRRIALPTPLEDPAQVVHLFEEALSPRTRLLLICHMINLTGQVLPVRKVVEMARRRGIPVIVDGAHSFAHFPFRREDLGCDYYATSLHKWLFAPVGTGMLYVRRERICDLWPLMGAPESMAGDIRKLEQIGTHPAAPYLAIGDALAFHRGLGAERKAARLIYLRDRWAQRLVGRPGVRFHTNLQPGLAYGIATFQIEGVGGGDLARHLWQRYRILVAAIEHPELEGIRVSPSVFTTEDEIDRFSEAVEEVLAHGLP